MSFQKAFAAFALTLAAVGATGFAHAQSSASGPYYFGASVGQSYSNLGGATKKSLVGMAETNDLRNTSGKVFMGYRKDNNWATEAGYADLGNARTHAASASASNSISAKLSTFYVVVIARENASEKFSVHGKLGVGLNHADGFIDRQSPGASNRVEESSWNLGPMFGIGAEYQLSPDLGLRVEYEYFGRMGAKGIYKTSLVTAGVIYKF